MLVTADEIPDPHARSTFTLRVNGETRQSSHTSTMIATGTPEGVGAALGTFLKAGDKLEAEVEKLGVLANRVVAA